MSAVPPEHRGMASGMRATLQNSGMLFSMGVFFTIVIVGLSSHLPAALYGGLTQAGLPAAPARGISHLPPTAALFATVLGYNPMAHLLPASVLAHLDAATRATLLGHAFFPHLIAPPFMDGLHDAFYVSMAMSLIAALAPPVTTSAQPRRAAPPREHAAAHSPRQPQL